MTLGNGHLTTRSVPVQATVSGSFWKSVGIALLYVAPFWAAIGYLAATLT